MTALGATLLVRIETEVVRSVFFDLLFQLTHLRNTPLFIGFLHIFDGVGGRHIRRPSQTFAPEPFHGQGWHKKKLKTHKKKKNFPEFATFICRI